MRGAIWLRREAGRVGLAFGFWTLIGLSFASQFYLSSFKAGRPVSWGQAVAWSLADWYVWAVLSVPIVHLARRYRFDVPSWGRNVGLHVVGSAVFSMLYVVLRALLGQWQSRMSGVTVTFGEAFEPLLVKTIQFNLLIYWVIVSVSQAFDYYRQYQDRALRASELEKRLAEARLQALQMQLNPHFLFNTLNAIASLMRRDVTAAERMIARLAELLRYALDRSTEQEVPLRQELSFLERYLEIEKARFGPRLSVRIDVDPAVMDVLVPNLLLQPLVENAIKHGVEKRSRPGQIELRACQRDGRLCLEVRDNGPGLAPGTVPREGIGVSNTRARLEHLYGTAQHFEMRNGAEGGMEVAVQLPCRPKPADGSPASGLISDRQAPATAK